MNRLGATPHSLLTLKRRSEIFRLDTGWTSLSSDSKMNRITICFCVFGIFTFFNQEMLLIASQDILSGLKLPTATILICSVTPLMITKIITPWFIQKIPYFVKVLFVALCMTLGLSLIVFVENIKVKLVGIALNSMATGTSEVTFLGLTSFYPQRYISAFVAGTGMACLVSPLYYTGKRNFLNKKLGINLANLTLNNSCNSDVVGPIRNQDLQNVGPHGFLIILQSLRLSLKKTPLYRVLFLAIIWRESHRTLVRNLCW